jgi:hypothetical protein
MSIHKRLSCCTYLCTWPRGIVLFAIVREKHAKTMRSRRYAHKRRGRGPVWVKTASLRGPGSLYTRVARGGPGSVGELRLPEPGFLRGARRENGSKPPDSKNCRVSLKFSMVFRRNAG